MSRYCTVCAHAEAVSINADLADGIAEGKRGVIAALARQHGLTPDAMGRHAKRCLPAAIAAAERLERRRPAPRKQQQPPPPVMTERREAVLTLRDQVMGRLEALRQIDEAVRRELVDPEDASRLYFGPRAEDVKVVYRDKDGNQRAAKLSELLAKLEGGEKRTGVGAVLFATERHADPRVLILRLEATLQRLIPLWGKWVGDGAGEVDLLASREWAILRAGICEALDPHPEAAAAVLAKLAELDRAADE